MTFTSKPKLNLYLKVEMNVNAKGYFSPDIFDLICENVCFRAQIPMRRVAALVIVLLCFGVTEAVTVQSFSRFVIILKLVIMPTICSTFRGEMQLLSCFC